MNTKSTSSKKIIGIVGFGNRSQRDDVRFVGIDQTKLFLQSHPDFDKSKHEIHTFHYKDLFIGVVNGKMQAINMNNKDVSLLSCDKVFFRKSAGRMSEKAYFLSMLLEAHNIPYLNRAVGQNRSRSKLTQHAIFSLHGATTPNSVLINSEVCSHSEFKFFDAPFILKSVDARRGLDNYLIEVEDDAIEILKNSEDDFLMQSYIAVKNDYRIVTKEFEPVMAIERFAANNSHLHNTSQDGKANRVELDCFSSELKAKIKEVATTLGYNLCGVDLLRADDGKLYFLEMNYLPQLEDGVFLDQKRDLLFSQLFD